jgi:hypothetical protein
MRFRRIVIRILIINTDYKNTIVPYYPILWNELIDASSADISSDNIY